MFDSLAFVDVETTGGSADSSRIIEIGIVRVDKGIVTEKYESLIDPEMSVPPFITSLTGITDDMVQNKPTFYGIAEKVQELLTDAVFVAHCVNFDYGFIRAEFDRLGMRFSATRLCTRDLSRKLFPDQKRHNLSTIIETHGFEPGSRHRALSDADVLWQMWQKFTPEEAMLKKLLKQPSQRRRLVYSSI